MFEVDIAAPGVDVLSTKTGGGYVGMSFINEHLFSCFISCLEIFYSFIFAWCIYAFHTAYSGTSMACPHVAGVAGLVWSHFPKKTSQEIRKALTASADDLGPAGRDDAYGHGLGM